MIILAAEGCFWPLTASMTSEVKKICPCLNSSNFEQIQWNKIFHRMYDLAVNLTMSVSGHLLIINEIYCPMCANPLSELLWKTNFSFHWRARNSSQCSRSRQKRYLSFRIGAWAIIRYSQLEDPHLTLFFKFWKKS